MKKMTTLIIVVLVVSAFWYLSAMLMVERYGMPATLTDTTHILSSINSIFMTLFFVGLVYAIYLLSVESKQNGKRIEQVIETNKLHLEIIALSSLIDECDTTLHRYDRWEEAGIKGDYASAKATVREKMNAHRESLERKLEEIEIAFEQH